MDKEKFYGFILRLAFFYRYCSEIFRSRSPTLLTVPPVIPEKNSPGDCTGSIGQDSNGPGHFGDANSVGNPINFITANKFANEVDYITSSVSSLQFTRHYNSAKYYQYKPRYVSAASIKSPLGAGWFHSYSQSLSISTQFVKYTLENGQAFYFYHNISGAWLADSDINFRLLEISSTTGGASTWKITTWLVILKLMMLMAVYNQLLIEMA